MNSPPKKENVTPKNILIVDDNPVNLRLLDCMLNQQGYQVTSAMSGSQALQAIDATLPDLILLDIMMPEMDGYQVCAHLKQDQRTCDIPIIFISALGETEDKVQAFTVGGVDYVTKPLQLEEVLARVQTHLALKDLRQQLQQANNELEKRLTELEARNEELDAFAHTVAHDLKNPLQLVMGYAGLLVEDYATLPKKDLQLTAQCIVRGSHKMDAIIESLLLLAGVRKLEAKPQVLDMTSIIEQVQQRLDPLIEKHQAKLRVPPPDSWPTAWGHAPWVEEIWANYISNAIKYGGEPATIELGATPPKKSGQACFWVRDNGPGIPEKDQERLFVPFERLGQVRVQGHGLGLSIVHRIAEKLGGQVWMESKDQGSTFYFSLPGAFSN